MPRTATSENDAVVARLCPTHAVDTRHADDLADRPRASRLRRMTWSVDCAGCRAGFAGRRRPWPAWRVGDGWSREATRTDCPGRCAACWSSTSELARGCFARSRLSPEFPRSAARMPRVNGSIGTRSRLDLASWRLRVVGPAGGRSAAHRSRSTRSRPFPGSR